MEIFEIFVDDEADEQIAARFLLFGFGQSFERFGEDLIGGAIADFVDEVGFGFGDGPGFADRGATLGNDATQFDIATDGERDAAFVVDVAIDVNLSGLRGHVAAGEAAENGLGCVSFVPGS